MVIRTDIWIISRISFWGILAVIVLQVIITLTKDSEQSEQNLKLLNYARNINIASSILLLLPLIAVFILIINI